MAYCAHIAVARDAFDSSIRAIERAQDALERNRRHQAAWAYARELGRKAAFCGSRRCPFTTLVDRAAWMEGFHGG